MSINKNDKEQSNSNNSNKDPLDQVECFGTTKLGKRGQVVIPAEIRDKLNLEQGEKFIVLQHGFGSVVFLREEKFKKLMKGFEQKIDNAYKDKK